MSLTVSNDGSAARDYCMLERNLLSHFKLALLLSLISSSTLLKTRLNGEQQLSPASQHSHAGEPMAALQMVGSLVVIGVGVWEYYNGIRDLCNMRAFLVARKSHIGIVTAITGVLFTTLAWEGLVVCLRESEAWSEK